MFKQILLSLLVCLVSININAKQEDSLYYKLDSYLRSANHADKLNGVVLVAQNNKILLHKGYGYRDFKRKIINDTCSIFEIGSLTKPFTALTILMLNEKGDISLSDKVSKFLTEYSQWDDITVKDLLSHTSGIYNYTNDIGEEDSSITAKPVKKERILALFRDKPLAFKAGEKFEYSNSNYFLLGMIIEKITGQPYDYALRKMLFESLGMKDSGFDFTNLKSSEKTIGYKKIQGIEGIPASLWDSTISYSAGAMYSTSNDLYRFVNAIGEAKILRKKSWENAFKPVLGNYGLGFFIDEYQGKRYIRHSGGLLGFSADFLKFPEDNSIIIVLNNYGNYDTNLLPLELEIYSIVHNMPYSNWIDNESKYSIDFDQMKKYEGEYEVDDNTIIKVYIEDNKLYAQGNTEKSIPKVLLNSISKNKFSLTGYNAQIEFVINESGEVYKFISHEKGKTIELKKRM